jgi:hypothetical protein
VVLLKSKNVVASRRSCLLAAKQSHYHQVEIASGEDQDRPRKDIIWKKFVEVAGQA